MERIPDEQIKELNRQALSELSPASKQKCYDGGVCDPHDVYCVGCPYFICDHQWESKACSFSHADGHRNYSQCSICGITTRSYPHGNFSEAGKAEQEITMSGRVK